MNPVSGPFTTFPSGPFSDGYRQKWKQASPHNLVLPYRMYEYYGKVYATTSTATTGSSSETKSATFSSASLPDSTQNEAACYNRAYAKFKGEVADSAGWAENVAQAGQARKMIVERATQAVDWARAVGRGNLYEAWHIFVNSPPFSRMGLSERVNFRRRFPEPKTGRSQAKDAAGIVLETEYGWRPLISDIQSSIKILNSDPGVRPVHASANTFIPFHSKTHSYAPNGGFASTTQVASGRIYWRIGGLVRVTNPNLALASQLGLIDLALPWKLIPYSFVVDWFVNVEQVLSSTSDWFGLQLLQTYNTRFAKGTFTSDSVTITNGDLPSWSRNTSRTERTFVEMRRLEGIPGPSLVMKPFKGFSVERAAQAVSLILGSLRNH